MLSFASQLKKPEAKEKFDTVVIDTLDELVFYAEEFIFAKYGVNKLNDIPWGAGYIELAYMFKRLFNGIVRDYGLIVIAHADLKVDPEDEERRYATLGFNKKVKKIVMGMLDVLGYVEASRLPENPNLLHFRSSEFWEAKCRFSNMTETIELSYDNIVKAVHDAVGNNSVEEHKDYYHQDSIEIPQEVIDSLKEKITTIAQEKIEEYGVPKVVKLIEDTLGKKVAECTVHDYEGLVVLEEEIARL